MPQPVNNFQWPIPLEGANINQQFLQLSQAQITTLKFKVPYTDVVPCQTTHNRKRTEKPQTTFQEKCSQRKQHVINKRISKLMNQKKWLNLEQQNLSEKVTI